MKINILKAITLALLSAFIFACNNSEDGIPKGHKTAQEISNEARKMQQEAKDKSAWQAAESQNTIAAYEVYLSDNQNQLYRKEATKRKTDLEATAEKARDESAWQIAKKQNTIASYTAYLSDSRNKLYINDAKKRKANLEKATKAQACQCSPKTFRSRSDHTWVEFRLPKATKNKVIKIKGGAYNKFVFPKCNRVHWSDLTFKCNPSSCRWQKTRGDWDSDAFCHGDKGNSPYVFVGTH